MNTQDLLSTTRQKDIISIIISSPSSQVNLYGNSQRLSKKNMEFISGIDFRGYLVQLGALYLAMRDVLGLRYDRMSPQWRFLT
jgi:hypothetical protein